MKIVASIIGAVLMLGALGVSLWMAWQYWFIAIDQTRQRFFWNYWQWEIGLTVLCVGAAICYTLADD